MPDPKDGAFPDPLRPVVVHAAALEAFWWRWGGERIKYFWESKGRNAGQGEKGLDLT